MKIIIDYGIESPTVEMMQTMNETTEIVKKRLKPIEKEFEKSQGTFYLHVDRTYELTQVPYKVAMKIQELIGSSFEI